MADFLSLLSTQTLLAGGAIGIMLRARGSDMQKALRRAQPSHRKVFDLLPAVETDLGMTLSPAFQPIPEQSTAVITVHHKDAPYYSVGASRVEQLMK